MLAHVDANNFYAACEQVFNPALRRRPVVVLSNNDGVIVARSAEARAIGIEMGCPFFQAERMLRERGVVVLSSNYTLYDDMSHRVTSIYRQFADEVEVYSIDECFLRFDQQQRETFERVGRELRQTVLRWVGLPIGVGIAPSKTLAKLANHLAKRVPERAGVCVLSDDRAIDEALGAVELRDLWGVSRGFGKRLAALNIFTPRQLRDADPVKVRSKLGVVGQRIVFELRGQPCIDLELVMPDKQNICCSRSFGDATGSFDQLHEAVATFGSQAAVKLRRQDLAAGAVSVFVGTDIHDPHIQQYHNSYGMAMAVPTFDTREIIRTAIRCLRQIYRHKHAYKKTGVMLHRLIKRTSIPPHLFDRRDHARTHRLMSTLDRINLEHGRGRIRLGSAAPFEFMPGRTVAWRGRCERRSPRYTTRWGELPTAVAGQAACARPPIRREPLPWA